MKLNTPNKITLFRIVCVVAIIILSVLEYYLHIVNDILPTFSFLNGTYTYLRLIILILFIICSLSDALDGYLARKNNQITVFGSFLDPIADKILINSTCIILAAFNDIPFFISILFILRDTLVDGLRLIAAKKQVVLSANIFGKIKTTLQNIALIAILFTGPIANNIVWVYWFNFILIILALLFSLLSGIIYIVKYKHLLKEE